MRATASDGVSLAYRCEGEGPRAVLLVHGWMMSGAVWDDLADALDTRGLRLIVPDLRGSGGSDAPADGYSLARHAEDIWSVAEAAGVSNPVLVGHSMGGQISMLVAANHGRDLGGLLLINPVPAAGMSLPDEATALFSSCAGDADKQGVILDMCTQNLSAEGRERLVAIAQQVAAGSITEGLGAWCGGGFEERLGDIDTPTRVVATDDDFLPPPLLQTSVTDKITGASQTYLAGCGHYPQVEDPVATAGIMRQFLDSLPAS